MAKLTAKQKRSVPKQQKGTANGFPMPDKSHARAAISGATRSRKAGNISKSTEAKVKAKARRKLGKKK